MSQGVISTLLKWTSPKWYHFGNVHFNSVEMTPCDTNFAKHKLKVIYVCVGVHVCVRKLCCTDYMFCFMCCVCYALLYNSFKTMTSRNCPKMVHINFVDMKYGAHINEIDMNTCFRAVNCFEHSHQYLQKRNGVSSPRDCSHERETYTCVYIYIYIYIYVYEYTEMA